MNNKGTCVNCDHRRGVYCINQQIPNEYGYLCIGNIFDDTCPLWKNKENEIEKE